MGGFFLYKIKVYSLEHFFYRFKEDLIFNLLTKKNLNFETLTFQSIKNKNSVRSTACPIKKISRSIKDIKILAKFDLKNKYKGR